MRFPVNTNKLGSINLGTGAIIDEGVILGYIPGRNSDQTLTIGPNARIREGTIIYSGSHIGSNLETGHNAIIREENDIGDNFRIWNNSVIDYGCKIGNFVKIQNKVYIGQYSVIENDVFIASGVTLANDLHPGCPDGKECRRGPNINKGAQISINCTILPRIVIGEHSVIGAGSVVTRDIPAGVFAYGNPAQVICDVEELDSVNKLENEPYGQFIEKP